MSPSPSHGGSIGDDGHGFAFNCVVVNAFRMRHDLVASPRHTWGVSHREHLTVIEREFVLDLDLPATMQLENAVGDLDNGDASQAFQCLHDSPLLDVASARQREVPHHLGAV